MRYAKQLMIVLSAGTGALTALAQQRIPAPVPQSQSGVSAETPAASAAKKETGEDIEFLTEALRTGLAEIEIARLAQQRTDTPAVREYGKKLQADHTKLVEEIKTILAPVNVTVPSEPTVEAQGHYAALAKLSGMEFDSAFLRMMIASHEEAIEKYGAQTHANPNKQLSEFAAEALPTLREHLMIAESLHPGGPPRANAHE
jgi:putative membrane protein